MVGGKDKPIDGGLLRQWLGPMGIVPLLIGASVAGLVTLKAVGGLSPEQSLQWILDHLGLGFSICFTLLLFLVLLGGHRMMAASAMGDGSRARFWWSLGQQAASGLSTLALTFTLLGIALGIGTLGQEVLMPQNVQAVIQSLSEHFSMAFMTTVVGLPSSALCQAGLVLLWQRRCASEGET